MDRTAIVPLGICGIPASVSDYLFLASLPSTTGKVIREGHVKDALDDEGVDTGFINRTVSWELEHIPRGNKGSLPNSMGSHAIFSTKEYGSKEDDT